ncbi:MAG: DivIVA domain-containing protein [Oscillospiraceae bacterium]|nr:DivIVA domain-containing protein [Oscillospiraceae bacterium]
MLTIDEIKNVSFRKASFNGYRPEDVDAFIDEVIVSFEQLKKEKADLVRKMDILATRVEQYRADEETVRNALLASQKVADASIREAKEKSAKILREAEAKAQKLLIETNGVTAKEKDNYLQLKTDAVQLREELKALYEKHMQTIDDLPTAVELYDKKEELDKKYPTKVQPVETDEETETAPVADVKEQKPEPEDFVPKTEKVTEAKPKKEVKAERPKRFDNLKFGDNYDVGEE